MWIHSREDGTGGLKVSTQFMYVDSSVLAGYQTSEAMAGAANSYGGINAQAVYLQPRAGRVTVVPAGGGENTNPTNPTNEGGNSSTSSPQDGGVTPSDPGTGGDTGGGSQSGGSTGGGENPPMGDEE